MTYKVVIVHWHDAHADSAWVSISDIENEPYIVQSVGWLIAKAKRGHISIAQSIGAGEHIDSVLHIPKKMVVSMVELTD